MQHSCPESKVHSVPPFFITCWEAVWSPCLSKTDICFWTSGLSEIAESQQQRYLLHCQIFVLFDLFKHFHKSEEEKFCISQQLCEGVPHTVGSDKWFVVSVLVSHMVHSDPFLNAAAAINVLLIWNSLCTSVTSVTNTYFFCVIWFLLSEMKCSCSAWLGPGGGTVVQRQEIWQFINSWKTSYAV